jgi:hypothetical protein
MWPTFDVNLPVALSSIADLDIYLAHSAKPSAIQVLVKLLFLKGSKLEYRSIIKV